MGVEGRIRQRIAAPREGSTVDPKLFAGAITATSRHVSTALVTIGWSNCLFLVLCTSLAWAIYRIDATATVHSAIAAAAAAHQTESTNRWTRQLFCDFISAWVFGPVAAPIPWQTELMPLWHLLGNR